MQDPAEQRRVLTALDAVIVFLAVILIAQVWLLGATLESYLGGHDESLVGLIASAVLFLGSFGLYFAIRRIDAGRRR